MPEKRLYLTISGVVGPLFEGEVRSVYVPGSEGDMTVLPRHAPLISPLRRGVIKVIDMQEEVKEFSVEKGLLEISGNQATILI